MSSIWKLFLFQEIQIFYQTFFCLTFSQINIIQNFFHFIFSYLINKIENVVERRSRKQQRMHQILTVHHHTLSDDPRGGKYEETLKQLMNSNNSSSSREVLRQTIEETWKLNQFPYLNPLTRMLRALCTYGLTFLFFYCFFVNLFVA